MPTNMAIIKKQTITSAGQDVEKLKCSHITSETIKLFLKKFNI